MKKSEEFLLTYIFPYGDINYLIFKAGFRIIWPTKPWVKKSFKKHRNVKYRATLSTIQVTVIDIFQIKIIFFLL